MNTLDKYSDAALMEAFLKRDFSGVGYEFVDDVITTLKEYAFAGITDLDTLSIPNVTIIPAGAFYKTEVSTSVTIPWNKITFIGNSAFYLSDVIKESSLTLPEVEEIDFHLDPVDLKIDTYRSSGAGGQHVNKTGSAIRITHLPTGTVVECQDERSQYKNKDRAMQILRSKLYEMEQAKQNAAVAAERKSQIGSGDRSERVRTYNFPQNRVTDHRLSGASKNFNIDRIMNGELDELIDALVTADQAAKLAENTGFGMRDSE